MIRYITFLLGMYLFGISVLWEVVMWVMEPSVRGVADDPTVNSVFAELILILSQFTQQGMVLGIMLIVISIASASSLSLPHQPFTRSLNYSVRFVHDLVGRITNLYVSFRQFHIEWMGDEPSELEQVKQGYAQGDLSDLEMEQRIGDIVSKEERQQHENEVTTVHESENYRYIGTQTDTRTFTDDRNWAERIRDGSTQYHKYESPRLESTNREMIEYLQKTLDEMDPQVGGIEIDEREPQAGDDE